MRTALDAETVRAAKAFLTRLPGKYVPRDVLVYGSRARGTHRADCDVDLAVILEGRGGDRYSVGCDMAAIAVDAMMETDILVQAIPLWEAELKQPELFCNPALIESIKREGLRP